METITSADQKFSVSSLLILGAGGLGQAVAEIARYTGSFAQIAFLDDQPSGHVKGPLSQLGTYRADFTHCIAAFGNNALRQSYTSKIKALGFSIPTMIHPSAVISPSARIASGCIVRESVVISHGVVVEEGSLLNIGCLIDHNCRIGAYSHIPMGAVVRNAVDVPSQSSFMPQEVIA